MKPRPYILAETNWKSVKATKFDLAVLPWGATEAHNFHLPYATDNIQCDAIAAAAAKISWESGTKVVVLPTVPFGVNTGQLDIPLDLNINPSTQMAILKDIAATIERSEIPKLVVLNGHGGNNFKQMIREVGQFFPKLFISTFSWYDVPVERQYFEDKGDHAGEMETSLIMHIDPSLVLPLAEAGSGSAKRFRVKAMQAGWAWAERKWSSVTADTGVGDPSPASAQKGSQFMDDISKSIATFFNELSAVPNDDLYED